MHIYISCEYSAFSNHPIRGALAKVMQRVTNASRSDIKQGPSSMIGLKRCLNSFLRSLFATANTLTCWQNRNECSNPTRTSGHLFNGFAPSSAVQSSYWFGTSKKKQSSRHCWSGPLMQWQRKILEIQTHAMPLKRKRGMPTELGARAHTGKTLRAIKWRQIWNINIKNSFKKNHEVHWTYSKWMIMKDMILWTSGTPFWSSKRHK